MPDEFEHIFYGPFQFLGIGVYILAFPLFVLTLFIDKIVPQINSQQTRALEGCIVLAVAFWISAILGWLGSRPYYSSLAHMIALGGLFGIIEGVYRVPVIPKHIIQARINADAKKELLVYENAKWWRGLSIFWAVVTTILIGGLFTFAARLPKVSEKELLHLLTSAFCAIPGIAMIVWNIIKRTNAIHESIFLLYIHEARRTKRKSSRICKKKKGVF